MVVQLPREDALSLTMPRRRHGPNLSGNSSSLSGRSVLLAAMLVGLPALVIGIPLVISVYGSTPEQAAAYVMGVALVA